MAKHIVTTSKFLSLVLRHQPETIGVALDPEGWIGVEELLTACATHGKRISRELLDEVVRTNDKKRFSFSEDGARIRANQGHSVDVDLGLVPCAPPEILYHGTVTKFLDSIRRSGLVKGNRHHVHLSADVVVAKKVGERRGRPVVLEVEAGRMARAGHQFYQSTNGVWLVDVVPVEFLKVPDGF